MAAAGRSGDDVAGRLRSHKMQDDATVAAQRTASGQDVIDHQQQQQHHAGSDDSQSLPSPSESLVRVHRPHT